MPAHVDEIDRAEAEGVQVETLVAPVELQRRGRTVTGLVIRRNELGAPGPDGRPVPVPLPGTEETWPFDLVISAIGEAVDADVAPGLTWGSAGLVVDEWGRTGRAEVWAAGDVVDMPRTVADAIGRAKRAALLLDARWRGLDPAVMLSRIQVAGGPAVSMAKYREALAGQPSSRAEDVVAYDQLNAEFFEPAAPRVALPQLPPGDGRHSFREVVGTLSAEAAASEAARCLSCGHCNGCDNCWIYCPDLCVSRESGHYHIDYDYCKGCTLCVAVCPRGAISTTEERKWRG